MRQRRSKGHIAELRIQHVDDANTYTSTRISDSRMNVSHRGQKGELHLENESLDRSFAMAVAPEVAAAATARPKDAAVILKEPSAHTALLSPPLPNGARMPNAPWCVHGDRRWYQQGDMWYQ